MISLLDYLSGDKMFEAGTKVRVTKCPGNGRVFTVIGELDYDIDVGKEISISGPNSWLFSSKIKRLENYGEYREYQDRHFAVYTENSVYVVEKLNE